MVKNENSSTREECVTYIVLCDYEIMSTHKTELEAKKVLEYLITTNGCN